MQGLLIENLKILAGAVPINTTGAAATSDWFKLEEGRNIVFAILQGAWAGGTPAVTLAQATSNAGAGSKALGMQYYYQSTALTSDIPTRTAIVANTFNLPASANTLTCVEVRQEDLDVNNSFIWVQISVASPGANTDLIAILAVMGHLAWSGDATKGISVI